MIPKILSLLVIALIVGFGFTYVNKLIQTNPQAGPEAPAIYQGAYIPNGQRELWRVTDLEKRTKKGMAIIHWYQGWGVTDGTQYFQKKWMNSIRNHGSIPMITWEPWDYTKGINQPDYSLRNIINGKYDAYIQKWAQDSKSWGFPYFLRFAHEMNASSYPWSEKVNGNQPGEYIQAWKHVRDIFISSGATNVTWVWVPNVEYSGTIPLEGLYPGDDYVDWVGMDGYNGGTALDWGGWLTFPQIFGSTYTHITSIAPTKPLMISEFASVEAGGSKADWIKDVYQTQLINNYPKVKAVVWFNENREADWRIESSSASQEAFAASIVSSSYAGNTYSNLNTSPIPAPEDLVVSTPTPAPSSPTPVPTGTQSDDTISPIVSITNPLFGATVKDKVKITAFASDNVGVTKVNFYINGVLQTSDTSTPYEYTWNTRKMKYGSHIIKVTAFDASNNSTSSEITVYK